MHVWQLSGSRSAALEPGPNVGFGPKAPITSYLKVGATHVAKGFDILVHPVYLRFFPA